MQNRLQSKVVWAAIIAQVLGILLALGVIDTGMSETINAVVVSVLQLLVALGVLNNPVNPTAF